MTDMNMKVFIGDLADHLVLVDQTIAIIIKCEGNCNCLEKRYKQLYIDSKNQWRENDITKHTNNSLVFLEMQADRFYVCVITRCLLYDYLILRIVAEIQNPVSYERDYL